MAIEETRPHESKIYYELSHLYDRIFTNVFFPRIRATVESLAIEPGAKVLEVGVGTGLSLSAYPEHAHVKGIDLAGDMLARAQEKCDREGWRHVELQQMDALNLAFEDESFDYVTCFHVVSVVPDPRRLMQEMTRVLRRGGTLALINHFRSERPWVAAFVDTIDPVTRKLGWRTTLRFPELVEGVPVTIERRYKDSPLSLFTVVVAKK